MNFFKNLYNWTSWSKIFGTIRYSSNEESKLRKTDFTDIEYWVILLRILRCLGQLPITFVINSSKDLSYDNSSSIKTSTPKTFERSIIRSNPGKYLKIEKRSFIYIVTILCGLFRLLVWYVESSDIQLIHCISKKSVSVLEQQFKVDSISASKTESLIGLWAIYSLPVINQLEWIFSFLTASLFIQFLNNWEEFNNSEFFIACRNNNYLKQESMKSMKWLYFVVIIPTMTFQIIIMSISYHLGYLHCVSRGGLIFRLLRNLTFQFVSLMEDVKVLSMFCAAEDGFSKIRQRILQFIESRGDYIQESHLKLNNQTIPHFLQNCLTSIKIARQQVVLIGTSQGPHEIMYLVYLISTMTFMLFLTFAPLLRGGDVPAFTIMGNLGALFLSLFRLYLKCHYAQKITSEERRIAETLIYWDVSKYDIDTKIQVRNLIDSMMLNPSKITYGSTISIDKSLLLSIGTQIVTYIIMLLQFNQSLN